MAELFLFAEYLAACREDEGEKNPPKPWRRRVDGFEEFRLDTSELRSEELHSYLKAKNFKLGILAYFSKNGVKYKRILNIKEDF